MVTEKDIEEQLEKLQAANTWQEKRNVIVTLEEWGVRDPKVMEALIHAAVKGEHRILRRTAVRVLGELADPTAVEPLIIVLLKAHTSDVRYAAASALGKIADARAVGPLAVTLGDAGEEMHVKEATAEALGKIATEQAVEALVATFEDENAGLVEKASQALKVAGELAVRQLIVALLSQSNTTRQWATVTLGEIRDKRAVESLVAILKDKDESYEPREKVAEALGKIGDARAVESLIQAASQDAEYSVRCLAVIALGDIGDVRAVDGLIRILEDKSSPLMARIRGLAAESLGKIGDRKGVGPLITALEDPRADWYVKDRSIWALGNIGDPAAEVRLLKVLRAELQAEESGWLRHVLLALDRLGFFDRAIHRGGDSP